MGFTIQFFDSTNKTEARETADQYQYYNTKILKLLSMTSSFITFFYIHIRRKYWIRENFRLPVFDGFTCFEMS